MSPKKAEPGHQKTVIRGFLSGAFGIETSPVFLLDVNGTAGWSMLQTGSKIIMTEKDMSDASQAHATKVNDKQARLSQALRDNLRRRKAQTRGRKAQSTEPVEDMTGATETKLTNKPSTSSSSEDQTA